jgi:hypothetical protein
MNSVLYIALKKVNYKPEQFRQQLFETEKAYNKLLATLKKYQLKEPQTLQAYCKTAFNQISAEESRIIEILKHLDTTKEPESSYFDSERLFLTEILNYAGSAKAEIVEYLAIYQPDIFKGSKRELIKQYLPPYNLIRKQFEANNSDQQPKEPKPEPEPTTTDQIFLKFKTKADRENVFDILKVYFEGQEKELLATIENKPTKPLLWPLSTKQLTEFFRRLEYNAVLFNNLTDIKVWLCANFLFKDKGEIKQLNPETVWTYLSKEKGNLSKTKRIGSEIDWLPYLNHHQQQENKKQE